MKQTRALLLLCLAFAVAACQAGGFGAAATATPEAPTATATSTVVWFPTAPPAKPTATLRPVPTATPLPPPEPGRLLLEEKFSPPGNWQVFSIKEGTVGYGRDELTFALSSPRANLISFRSKDSFEDIYLEMVVNPTLCQGSDQFGVLFRVQSENTYDRLMLTCAGSARLERFVNGASSLLQDWINSPQLAASPDGVKLGIWAVGKDVRLYLNDTLLFSAVDDRLSSGSLGLYARSMGETALTVNFSELKIYEAFDK
ncbi:MAG TPA: hypothetical protein PKW33_03855 [Anaerolineaceae bacterium]|nr:hypothetical protein [Anaerolineaceae bacterium]HPN50696.1 hypothetical protein [Anaerolineaceae bacterium]